MNLRFIFIIFLLLPLSGCALIYSYSDSLPQDINKWIATKKYNVALNTISYVQPKHKDYRTIQRQKKRILKLVVSYENMAIKKSSRLTRQGNWLKAFKLLDEVADNLIDTDKIENHYAKLLKKRNKVIIAYENDLLYNQAIYLANKMKLYGKIKKIVSKKEENQLDITQFDDLRKETNLRLTNRCENQYKNGQYDYALTTIDLTLKLKPEKEIVTRLENIKKLIKKEIKHKKTIYVKDIKTLISKLSQGHSHEILRETKDKIAWLDKIRGKDKTYIKLLANLKKHLTAGVKQHFEAGRRLYSKGKTQEALSIWTDLITLDPDHPKLQSHIERAEKVLSKLEKLSNKPQPKK